MTDDEWLGAMAKYSTRGPTRRGREFVGGSEELSRELGRATSDDPERFAALASCMEPSLAGTYFEAILRGLTRSEGGVPGQGRLTKCVRSCTGTGSLEWSYRDNRPLTP